MSDQEFILAPATVNVDFQIRPKDIISNSLAIINQYTELSGLGEWVRDTYNAMTEQQRRFHMQLFHVFLKCLEDEETMDMNFPQYIDWIKARDPLETRDGILKMFLGKSGPDETLTVQQLAGDKQAFMKLIEGTIKAHADEKGWDVDMMLYEEAHDLMQSPQQMLDAIVKHLTYMWEAHLKAEWERNLPILQECVKAYKQLNFDNQTAIEAMRSVTGRDMSEYWGDMDDARNIVFLPTTHIGPYNAYYVHEGVAYIFFGARMPHGMRSKSPALSRSELLVRLNALADDTRLMILELLTQEDELCAQDIINQLNLSQSSASRHLRQLTATGYLIERRRDVAKCYSLNQDRREDTINAIRHFLGG